MAGTTGLLFWTMCGVLLALALTAPSSGDIQSANEREKRAARSKRSTTCNTTTSVITQAQKNTLLAAHKTARGAVSPTASNMVDLEWDDDLAELAQYSANICENEHGNLYTCDGVRVGQNIHVTTRSLDLNGAVTYWDSEKSNYSYSSNACASGEVCGHYTQVVWAKSVKVGCGYKMCSTMQVNGQTWNNATLTFCNYSPAGNMGSEKPYTQGTACTACDVTNGYRCDNGVCVNCLPSSDSNCQCTKTCQNGGTRDDQECTCTCAGNFYGNTCASLCEDIDGCTSWAAEGYCAPSSEYHLFVTSNCPSACNLC